MRSDAASLLARLKQTDLRYQEFSDPLADVEPWPIFEALLADVRVISDPAPPAAPVVEEHVPSPYPTGSDPVSAPPAGLRAASRLMESMIVAEAIVAIPLTFGDYGSDQLAHRSDLREEIVRHAATRPKDDLRTFLSRLSAQHNGSGR